MEHSVVRVIDEGFELEGVVLGGSPAKPFAIRYAVMADPEARCRGVTVRAIGSPTLFEILGDGEGRWTTSAGENIPELAGTLDINLEISPVTDALALRRLNLAVGDVAERRVACIDVLRGQAHRADRRYRRTQADTYRIDDPASGASDTLIVDESGWALEAPL